MAAPGRRPAFFKLYNPDFSSERLEIPSAFIAKMKGKLPDKAAFLRDVFGNVWPMEVISESETMYFRHGWVKFVEDNGVELGDIVVFQFNGDYFFDVKVFGKDECEKVEDFGSFELPEEEEEDVIVTKITMTGSKKKTGSNSATKGKAVGIDEVGTEDNVNKPDRCIIFESGLIAPPSNPYFIAHLKQNKRNELFVPPKVIKDNNLVIPGEIIIIGEDGKEFHSNVSMWKDGRKRVTNGWRAFCRWNFVEEEDTCLCEFVSSQTLFIRVLKFQAGKWMPKPRGLIAGPGD